MMPTNAERLYEGLNTADEVRALLGQTEDADFDCKQWFPQKSMRESIAKAACAFTNATGGVIVLGLEAKKIDGIDVVQSEKPVQDVNATQSDVLDAISKIVEPGIEGIQSKTIPLSAGNNEGFVAIFIPESQGTPHRSTATKEFYVRIGPQSLPMAYFQIADRFGRRPHPRLVVSVSDDKIDFLGAYEGRARRRVELSVSNEGRGLARFPALRCRNVEGVFFPQSSPGAARTWPYSDAVLGWMSFRGGANDVVHPGDVLQIAKLTITEKQTRDKSKVYEFPEVELTVVVSCDGMPAHEQVLKIPENVR